jgi:hypothetical protein
VAIVVADRRAEDAGPDEALSMIAARAGWTESQDLGEGRFSIGALWSVTRFGYSVLQ